MSCICACSLNLQLPCVLDWCVYYLEIMVISCCYSFSKCNYYRKLFYLASKSIKLYFPTCLSHGMPFDRKSINFLKSEKRAWEPSRLTPKRCKFLCNWLIISKFVLCTFTGMVTAICWCNIHSNWGYTEAKHFGEPHFGDFALYYR